MRHALTYPRDLEDEQGNDARRSNKHSPPHVYHQKLCVFVVLQHARNSRGKQPTLLCLWESATTRGCTRGTGARAGDVVGATKSSSVRLVRRAITLRHKRINNITLMCN